MPHAQSLADSIARCADRAQVHLRVASHALIGASAKESEAVGRLLQQIKRLCSEHDLRERRDRLRGGSDAPVCDGDAFGAPSWASSGDAAAAVVGAGGAAAAAAVAAATDDRWGAATAAAEMATVVAAVNPKSISRRVMSSPRRPPPLVTTSPASHIATKRTTAAAVAAAAAATKTTAAAVAEAGTAGALARPAAGESAAAPTKPRQRRQQQQQQRQGRRQQQQQQQQHAYGHNSPAERQYAATLEELTARRSVLRRLHVRRADPTVRACRIWPEGVEFSAEKDDSSRMTGALEGLEFAAKLYATPRLAAHVPRGALTMMTAPAEAARLSHVAGALAALCANAELGRLGCAPSARRMASAATPWLGHAGELAALQRRVLGLAKALSEPGLARFFPRDRSGGSGGGGGGAGSGAVAADSHVRLAARAVTLPSSAGVADAISATLRRARVLAALAEQGQLGRAELLLPELLAGPNGTQYAEQLAAGRASPRPGDNTPQPPVPPRFRRPNRGRAGGQSMSGAAALATLAKDTLPAHCSASHWK